MIRWVAPLVLVSLLGCTSEEAGPNVEPTDPAAKASGVKAFDTIYAALMHPRCLNCHPAGDQPLQTDASTPHAMNVQRGPKGEGLPGLSCSSCHQTRTLPGKGMPPGVKGGNWHLAPSHMAFEGCSKRQLALMLRDSDRSGMSGEELIAHVRDDALVGYGWKPYGGRKPVPVPRADLVKGFETWVAAGMPVPNEGRKE